MRRRIFIGSLFCVLVLLLVSSLSRKQSPLLLSDDELVAYAKSRSVKVSISGSEGSGTVLNATEVLTAHHVVKNSLNVRIRNDRISVEDQSAKVIGFSASADLALLQVKKPFLVSPIVLSTRPSLGTTTIGIGLYRKFPVRKGVVIACSVPEDLTFVCSSASVYRGFSGSGFYDNYGLIGILIQGADEEKYVDYVDEDTHVTYYRFEAARIRSVSVVKIFLDRLRERQRWGCNQEPIDLDKIWLLPFPFCFPDD